MSIAISHETFGTDSKNATDPRSRAVYKTDITKKSLLENKKGFEFG